MPKRHCSEALTHSLKSRHLEPASSSGAVADQASLHVHHNESTLPQEWPFETDFGDHFETPRRAFEDMKPLLKRACKLLGLRRRDACIYDPYFCRGASAAHLKSLGFPNVINNKRDFYADISSGAVPAFHILVSNPPYSGDHKSRLFSWILDTQREAIRCGRPQPFMLLLPAWTSKWLPWRTFLWALARLRSGRLEISMEDAAARVKKLANLRDNQLETKAAVFYFVPGEKYEYSAAVRSRDTAPFYGVWFCGGFPAAEPTATANRSVFAAAAKRAAKSGGAACCSVEAMASVRSAGGERVVVAPEEERVKALSDPAALQRRNDAIAKVCNPQQYRFYPSHYNYMRLQLEATRALKPRKRNYDSRAAVSFSGQLAADSSSIDASLADPRNARACRHFFLSPGGSGCSRGSTCRFSHVLAS